MTPDDVTNLGFRTDLMVLGEQTVFASLGDGLLVRSPTNPSFFWGNFLLLRRPPPPTQVAATIARFQSAMAEFADVRHVAIGWDHVHGDGGWSDDDTIAAFEALGFNAERGMVLTSTAQRIHSRAATGFEIRPPIGADEWELLVQMQLDSSPMPYPRAFRETFQRARNAQLRADIDRGRALWRCAWIDGQIAGSMGLVAQDGLGRYQSVQTHPDFRRQGVCSALLAAIADAGAVELGAEQLVIVTDAGSVAERIYRQQGFVAAMPTHGVCLPPQR